MLCAKIKNDREKIFCVWGAVKLNKKVFSTVLVVFVAAFMVVAVAMPNPARDRVLDIVKAKGYLDYTPIEAYKLARRICTQCHTDERIKMYCPRCGPPFVAVVPHMQIFIQNYKTSRPDLVLENISEVQAVAIVQVWNALVGNWEKDFRERDIERLIGRYPSLVALYKTPVDKRPIESALGTMDSLKIGHMTGLKEAQKDLGNPEAQKKQREEDAAQGKPAPESGAQTKPPGK
jgi:hypothetical protein